MDLKFGLLALFAAALLAACAAHATKETHAQPRCWSIPSELLNLDPNSPPLKMCEPSKN